MHCSAEFSMLTNHVERHIVGNGNRSLAHEGGGGFRPGTKYLGRPLDALRFTASLCSGTWLRESRIVIMSSNCQGAFTTEAIHDESSFFH